MELMTYTDENLAERFEHVDERFDQSDRAIRGVDRRVAETKEDLVRQASETKEDVVRQIGEVDGRVRELAQAVRELHWVIARGNFALIVCLVGLIGTLLVKGG
ncbi:MAG TPA: hypothetical protein VF081_13980 [Solirubrobacterales bacterium]